MPEKRIMSMKNLLQLYAFHLEVQQAAFCPNARLTMERQLGKKEGSHEVQMIQ